MEESQLKPPPSLAYISRSIVRSFSYQQSNEGQQKRIHLTPWDLMLLPSHYIQKGILLPKPPTPLNLNLNLNLNQHREQEQELNRHPVISRLVNSLSQTLDHFFPLTGRLSALHHDTSLPSLSVFIDCNNQGAEFILAAAKDFAMSDLLNSLYTPDIVRSFFPLNFITSHGGHSHPLLAVQLTELSDGGIFIGCSINHAVIDGTSFWHFFNSWSEISRTGLRNISSPPILDRWFLDSCTPPIHLPFKDHQESIRKFTLPSQQLKECFFHFSAQAIRALKARANSEMNTTRISSLQSLLARVWISVIRARKLDPSQETTYILAGGNRSKIDPPLPAAYFGNSLFGIRAKAVAGDILNKGLGWVAWQLNQAVATQTDGAIRKWFELWCETPSFVDFNSFDPYSLLTGSSPRFNIYGNDFGWGMPIAVRSGCGNKLDGKVYVYPGLEEGSIALDICLSVTALKSLVEDMEFMEATKQ